MPSSVIRHFEYNVTTRELRVTFVSGKTYVYADVPEPLYRTFRAAFSKGEFFNRHIRDKYRYAPASRTG
jgi:KTSC domain